jgi:hypothetical protein
MNKVTLKTVILNVRVEGSKLVTDDINFLLTSGTRNRVDLVAMIWKRKRDVYIVTSINTVK